MNIEPVIFENGALIVECEVERDTRNHLEFYNILITDKESGRTYESVEMPGGCMSVAKAVANASLRKEED